MSIEQGTVTLKQKYREYLRSDDWAEKRGIALSRARYKCVICSERSRLEVHHLKYRSWFDVDPLKDLLVLCKGCHGLAHALNVTNIDKKNATHKIQQALKPRRKKLKPKKPSKNQKRKDRINQWIDKNSYVANGHCVIDVNDLKEYLSV